MSNDAGDIPWYKNRTEAHPFRLVRKILSKNISNTSLHNVAIFPWTDDSIDTLWNGRFNSPEMDAGWHAMISDWEDAFAVAGTNGVSILFARQLRRPVFIPLSDSRKRSPIDFLHIAWACAPHALLEPLVVFSDNSLIYIYNVITQSMVGYLRGHGGPITSIAVHPNSPNLFCTTSRDFSTRIYDLSLKPQLEPQNPHWLPATQPSRSGAAHGLHMTESEGSGIGRCVTVLMGGRSGGHQAAVLGAAFHPALPVVATCGMDRTVKIWHTPPVQNTIITRQDKPLFTSSRIHNARVHSVTWLDVDILVTHSGTAIMRKDPHGNDNLETYLEPGTLSVWRWLGVERFFPANQPLQETLRGCISDFQESSSFRILSKTSFPPAATRFVSPRVHVYKPHIPLCDPMVLYIIPNTTSFRMINVIHLPPRKAQPFPPDEDAVDVMLAKKMRLDDDSEDSDRTSRERNKHPDIEGWDVSIDPTQATEASGVNPAIEETIEGCAMGMSGEIIVGVGSKGTIWVWGARRRYVDVNEPASTTSAEPTQVE